MSNGEFVDMKARVARMDYGAVKAVLRSHGVELWLDEENIVRTLLAERIESGEIQDPTRDDDTIMTLTPTKVVAKRTPA
jgi:hypothetical protein